MYLSKLKNAVNLEMVEIPGGLAIAGSANQENLQHSVNLSSFYLAKFPITQKQWQQVAQLPQVERNLPLKPAKFSGEDLPVENVSWFDAREFCLRLSQATGKQYQLPSEVQWEYACRAKTITPFYFGQTISSEVANYNGRYTYANEAKGEYRRITTPVNKFPPNAFGLYDLHGNVWEWCADDWHENYQNYPGDRSMGIASENNIKVIRGGSWGSRPSFCCSAYRDRFIANNSNNFIGFRCMIKIYCAFHMGRPHN